MRDHDDAAQAEEVAAARRLGVEPRPQAASPPGRIRRPPSFPRVVDSSSERSATSRLRIVPSRVLRATLPVKPSHTITSASPSSKRAPFDVALEVERARLEQRVGVERQLIPLLGLLADREQAHPGPVDPEHLLREDRAHVAELEQVLGPCLRVRAGVDQDGGAVLGGDHDRDPGAEDAGRRRTWSRLAASTAPVFPAETTASASPSPTARTARTSEESGLQADDLGRLVVHLDRLARDDVREAVRVEVGRAEDDGLDALLRGDDGAGDDLLRGMVAPEGVHGDPAAHLAYGAGVPSG